MSDYNIKLLKGAYRHPFEYINPRLYHKKDDIVNTKSLGKSLHVQSEDLFLEIMREERGDDHRMTLRQSPTNVDLEDKQKTT